MKNIKKIGKAVAGSALLVGATLAGGASFALAQSSGSSGTQHNLGDYPAPYVGEDGNVDASIVVGQSAKTVDVVGAIDIAGSLSQAAFTEKTVQAGGSGAAGSWSASQGVTLDTRNDNLYFGDKLNTVRDTLTQEQLDTLQQTTFRDDSGDETDVENYLYPGNLQTTFGKPDDRNNQDPIHYVSNPADPSASASDHLFQLQANFEDEIDFAAEDVEDEEIQLFGQTYTVSTDTNSNELVLLGSQETTSIDTGSSKTVTISGNEHTIEVVAVTGSNPGTAAFRVDGQLMEKDEEDTFTIDGQEVRLDDIIQTNADNSQGTVQFAVGSDELVLQNGAQIEDGDGNDIDGTYVEFQSLDNTQNSGDDTNDGSSDSEEFATSGINVYVGAEDSDREYVMAGESYSHSLFPDFTFRYGGLAPNAMEEGDSVHEVSFSTSGDDTVTTSFTSAGSSTSLEVLHDDDTTDGGSTGDAALADDDDDQYVVEEGESVTEDQYFTADAGDFSHIWEVTNIDRDTVDQNEGSTGNEFSSGDEATITLQDAVTGDSVEVDLDVSATGDADVDYSGTEVIDGQTYHFTLDGAGTNPALRFAYGSGAGITVNSGSDDTVSTGVANSGVKSLYAPVDTASGSAMALTEEVEVVSGHESVLGTEQILSFELPSTESTDAKTVDVSVTGAGTTTNADSESYDVDIGDDGSTEVTVDQANDGADFKVGETVYNLEATSFSSSTDGSGGNSTVSFSVSVDSDQSSDGAVTGGVGTDSAQPGVLTVLPEDDQDNEEAYFVSSNLDTGDDQVTVNNAVYTGAANARQTPTLESNSDVTAGVDYFGTYTEYDSDEQHTFSMFIPEGQATAGAAFTAQGGSLSASAGGAGSVTTMQPAGWPDVGALDSDSNIGQLKNNRNLILVGGPAVNSLVQELADAGKTQAASEYSDGQAIVQQIDNAFSQGNDALVVAGQSGQDTREAANFLANYEANQDRMAGKDKVTLTTAQSTQ